MDLVPDISGTKISFKFMRFYALALIYISTFLPPNFEV